MTEKASTGFAGRLKQAQAEVELTNEELAREIGVSLRLLQRWRAGSGTPNGQNLVTLAAALEKDPSWFYSVPVEDRTAA